MREPPRRRRLDAVVDAFVLDCQARNLSPRTIEFYLEGINALTPNTPRRHPQHQRRRIVVVRVRESCGDLRLPLLDDFGVGPALEWLVERELSISARTVETHLRHLFERLGIASRIELATRALREGWLDVPA